MTETPFVIRRAGAALNTVTEAFQRIAWAEATNRLAALPYYSPQAHYVAIEFTTYHGDDDCTVWLVPRDAPVNDRTDLFTPPCRELNSLHGPERTIVESLIASRLIGDRKYVNRLPEPLASAVHLVQLPAPTPAPRWAETLVDVVLGVSRTDR